MGNLIWIEENAPPDSFPPVDRALQNPEGLLAAGGDLSVARLLAAYRRGIFPWYSEGQPILWWSPNPRTILFTNEMKISRSLAKTARHKGFVVAVNRNFAAVMSHCAAPDLRATGTWITPDMQAAYLKLHQLGHAYSVETWLEGNLVGGLYGVRLGAVFFGESMFSRVSDASKIALKALCQGVLGREIAIIDCQMATPHLCSLGARSIPREEFIRLLALNL